MTEETTLRPVARPALEIVIVNWNSGTWLRECLRALANAAPRACTLSRVVVVDNASTDESCECLDPDDGRVESDAADAGTTDAPREDARAFGGHTADGSTPDGRTPDGSARGGSAPFGLALTIIRNRANRGFAAACNQGAAGARGDYLLFLNPDTVPTAEALDGAIGLLEAHAADAVPVRIAGVSLDGSDGPQTLWLGAFPTARTFMLQALGRQQGWRQTVSPSSFEAPVTADDAYGAIEVAVVNGAFLAIARALFEDLGGFDERFFMYFDELDLCLRARKRGARAMIASRIRIYHQIGASSDRVPARRLFYLLRSRLLYARAHFTATETAALALLMCTTEPLLRLARATAGRGPNRLRDVLEAYARFAASLAGLTRDTTG